MRLNLRAALTMLLACAAWTPVMAAGVYLSAGSEPGWRPPVGADREVTDKMIAVLNEIDQGRYEQAYENFDPSFKQITTVDQFVQVSAGLAAKTGPMRNLRVVRVTWTKPPAGGSLSGLYAAVDIARTFQRAKRDCGYVVLRQAPGDTNWNVLRIDDNLFPDAIYDEMIEKGQAKQAAALWARQKQGCPNSS